MGPLNAFHIRAVYGMGSGTPLTWICQARGFEYDVVERALAFHQLLDSGNASVFDTTAKTSVGKLKELL